MYVEVCLIIDGWVLSDDRATSNTTETNGSVGLDSSTKCLYLSSVHSMATVTWKQENYSEQKVKRQIKYFTLCREYKVSHLKSFKQKSICLILDI